jgi:hypothetical protein
MPAPHGRLSTQLARTEEAAKRALVRSDAGARGGTAQRLLDAQREAEELRGANADLTARLARWGVEGQERLGAGLDTVIQQSSSAWSSAWPRRQRTCPDAKSNPPRCARERRRASDCRAAAEDARRRLEGALREQRALVRRLGLAEAAAGGKLTSSAAPGASTTARQGGAASGGGGGSGSAAEEEEYWSEEAGRRFAAQQEELVELRERVAGLQAELNDARGGPVGGARRRAACSRLSAHDVPIGDEAGRPALTALGRRACCRLADDWPV